MTTTPNLGFTIYTNASGSATTFNTYRLATSGPTGNFVNLDGFLGDTSSSIIALRAAILATVNANFISTNYYEAISSSVTNYNTGMIINLKLSASITGTTTININSFGVKTLKKVNSSGTIVDVVSGDLIAGKYYLFTYDGTQFVMNSSDATSGSSTGGSTVISGSYSGSPPIFVTGSVISISLSGSSPISFAGSVISLQTSGVTAGSGNQFIVDKWGRITSSSYIASGSSSGTTYTGSPPINIAGSVVSLTNTGTIWLPDAKPSSASALDDEFDNSSLTGWTNFDPYSDITVGEDIIGGTIQSNTGGSTFFGGIYKSFVINGANTGTIWTKITNNTPIANQVGIMIGQNLASSPSTSDIITLGWETPDEQKTIFSLKSWSSYSGSITVISSASCTFYNPTAYLRITYDGGSLYADFSHNGIAWTNVAYAYVIPFNSLQIGIFGYATDGENNPVDIMCHFFRFSSDYLVPVLMKGNRVKIII